jgi:hypothetical protein
VEVTAFAPPAEAHARIAYALAEIRRFLVPVSKQFYFQIFSSHYQRYHLIYWNSGGGNNVIDLLINSHE